MIDLLINVAPCDKNVDIKLSAHHFDVGDVIDIKTSSCPHWGMGELTHENWRILRLTNIPIDHAVMLLSHEILTFEQSSAQDSGKSVIQRVRGFGIDPDFLKSEELIEWFADDSRKNPILTISLNKDILDIIIQHPHIVDPDSGL